jgi:uncharacterized protein YdhG (YjbR/CyaY superfamily)
MAKKPTDMDEFLAQVEPERRRALQRLRRTVRKLVPRAEECLSYGIPAFRLDGAVIGGFAPTKDGCSYYPFSGHTFQTLAKELEGWSRTKSALHFDVENGIPEKLLRKLLKARIGEGLGRPKARPQSGRIATSARRFH